MTIKNRIEKLEQVPAQTDQAELDKVWAEKFQRDLHKVYGIGQMPKFVSAAELRKENQAALDSVYGATP